MPKAAPKKKRGKSPRCKTCDKPIRVPQDWSIGAAVRRHYWAKHPDCMNSASRRNVEKRR